MPTYEYYCEKCHHKFEFFQSMKDKPLDICPQDKCGQKKWGKGKVKRLIGGGAGLIFKGSGFYITDYRSDSYKASAKKDSEHSSPKSTTTTTSTSGSSTSSPSATTSSSKTGGNSSSSNTSKS